MTPRPAAGSLAEIGALRWAARHIIGRAEAGRRCARADTKAGLRHEVVMVSEIATSRAHLDIRPPVARRRSAGSTALPRKQGAPVRALQTSKAGQCPGCRRDLACAGRACINPRVSSFPASQVGCSGVTVELADEVAGGSRVGESGHLLGGSPSGRAVVAEPSRRRGRRGDSACAIWAGGVRRR